MDAKPELVTTIGFVGLGQFAAELAEACERCTSIRIGACFDPIGDRAEDFSQRFDCRRVGSFERLCRDPELEGVVVASPNHIHCEQAIALAEAGKHVFVEKPLGTDLDQVDRIIAACQAARRLLAVGHQERRASPYRHIKQMIDDGALGRIYSFEANHCGNLLDAWPADDWRFGERGVGPLLHKGIHKIDVLNHLFGSALSVSTSATDLASNPEMHETAVCVLRYDCGAIGSLTAGFRYNNASFNVYGEYRSVRYSGHGHQIQVKNERTWQVETIDCGSDDPLAEEMDEFAAAIRGRATVEVDGAAAREAILVAVAADLAARDGSTVALDPLRDRAHLAGTVA